MYTLTTIRLIQQSSTRTTEAYLVRYILTSQVFMTSTHTIIRTKDSLVSTAIGYVIHNVLFGSARTPSRLSVAVKNYYFRLIVFRAYNTDKITKATNLHMDNIATFCHGRSFWIRHTTTEMYQPLLDT